MTVRSRGALAFALAALLVSSLSCAHDQQLVSITIQPDVATFGASNIPPIQDAGLSRQLRALGNYIHPPVTKDITDQVTWGSDTPDLVTVTSTGLIVVTSNGGCGDSLISATVNTNSSAGNRSSSGAIVTGFMTAKVICFTGTGSGPLLAVNILGTGSVSSNPSGISCPSTCSANFASGTAITLTATLTGSSTSVTWSGCTPSGLTCTINSLTADTVVTATFN